MRVQEVWSYLVNGGSAVIREIPSILSPCLITPVHRCRCPSLLFPLSSLSLSPFSHIGSCVRYGIFANVTDMNGHRRELRWWIGAKTLRQIKKYGRGPMSCVLATTFAMSSLPLAKVQPCGTVWLNYSRGKSWPFSREMTHWASWITTSCLSRHFIVFPFFDVDSWKLSALRFHQHVTADTTEAEKHGALERIIWVLNMNL